MHEILSDASKPEGVLHPSGLRDGSDAFGEINNVRADAAIKIGWTFPIVFGITVWPCCPGAASSLKIFMTNSTLTVKNKVQ
jgi:hypothetical protein